MTFEARFKVQDVGAGPSPITVLAVAESTDITQTTENVQSIELNILLNVDETELEIGDIFALTGHLADVVHQGPSPDWTGESWRQ